MWSTHGFFFLLSVVVFSFLFILCAFFPWQQSKPPPQLQQRRQSEISQVSTERHSPTQSTPTTITSFADVKEPSTMPVAQRNTSLTARLQANMSLSLFDDDLDSLISEEQ